MPEGRSNRSSISKKAFDVAESEGMRQHVNHCALCENLASAYMATHQWDLAAQRAADAVRYDPVKNGKKFLGSVGMAAVGARKLIAREARHARLAAVAGNFETAVEVATSVLGRSMSHNTKKRRAEMMMARAVANCELALRRRDAELLDSAESELSQSVSIAERGFGQKSFQVADHLELLTMFLGSIRHDYELAETTALRAVHVREMAIAENLRKEKIFAGAGDLTRDTSEDFAVVDVRRKPCRMAKETIGSESTCRTPSPSSLACKRRDTSRHGSIGGGSSRQPKRKT